VRADPMRSLAYEWAFDITGQFCHIYTDCKFAASLIFFLSFLPLKTADAG
jgi:hypothetical protein